MVVLCFAPIYLIVISDLSICSANQRFGLFYSAQSKSPSSYFYKMFSHVYYILSAKVTKKLKVYHIPINNYIIIYLLVGLNLVFSEN